MADSDYTVAVVLQAADEGMSSTLKKTSDGLKETGKSARDAKVDTALYLVELEALTSGLNQVTGGMRKFTSALNQTGLATDETAEEMNKYIAFLELATGPMETMIAIQKIATATSLGETFARKKEAVAKSNLMIVNNSLMASMAVWLVIIIAIIGVLYLLYQAWKHQEEIMEFVSKQVDKVTDGFKGMVQTGREVSHTLQEIASGAGAALEPMQRIIGVIPGLGGD